MNKIVSLLICLLLLCGCQSQKESVKDEPSKLQSSKTTQTTQEKAIAVNVDKGKILKVGDQLIKITDYLDEFVVSEMESGVTYYENDGIIITVKSNQVISQIVLKSDKYELNNGMKVGQQVKDLEEACQTFNQEYDAEYDNSHNPIVWKISHQDMKIEFKSQNGTVTRIDMILEEKS